jgi:ATP-dependent Clp protease ATP-binding subunit ClpX
MKQFKKLFSMENVDLEIRDDALLEIAKKAIERKSGARGLRSIMENILLDLMYDIPSDQNIEKVVLDSSSVSGESDPLVVYSQSEAPKESSN